MNQSLKWKNNYIFFVEKHAKKKKKTTKDMDSVLDRMHEGIDFSVSKNFSQHFVKVILSSYALVRTPRGKILGQKQKKLFETAESITKNIYHNYARGCFNLCYSSFPYFKPVRNFGDHNFHF